MHVIAFLLVCSNLQCSGVCKPNSPEVPLTLWHRAWNIVFCFMYYGGGGCSDAFIQLLIFMPRKQAYFILTWPLLPHQVPCHCCVESAAMINQAPKEHYWPGMLGLAHLQMTACSVLVFCFGFFSIKSVENCSGGHETFLYFYLLWYGIFFVKAICDWHLKMNNSKRLNWNYMGLFCKQISELVYSVKIRWR